MWQSHAITQVTKRWWFLILDEISLNGFFEMGPPGIDGGQIYATMNIQ